MVPADKAANNVVVVCRLHYVNTLKQELDGTRAYLETDTDEVSVVNAHLNDLPVKFSVCVNEGQDKLPTMYWLPKLHKRPYKARFIANSSPCTTTELSKLLTSCLTAIKSHVIRYCETVYETSNKNWFWSIKNSGEVLSKLKCRGFRATSLSTYDFSTLYTTLPHNLIKEKGTSRQRSGKGAIRKRFPLQKPRWEKTKLTIRYLYHETYRKPNEQLFSQ